MKIEVKNFNLEETITSGSCFRVLKEEDGSFTNILSDRVINIKQEGNNIYVESSKEDNLKEVILDYFDLKRDYKKIIKELSKIDDIKEIVNNCKNYKILNQDSFEMCISYIISQQNQVTKISKSVNKLSENYGTKVTFKNKEYYLFPTYQQLKNISIEELKNYSVGFRDKYIREFLDRYESIPDLNKLSTKDALNELMKIKGIGIKVASCILLFGYKRLDTFPIDTWVKKYISNNYNIKDDVNYIKKFTEEKYKEYSGLVIQYMFHSERNK